MREAYAEKRKVQDWPLALLFWQQANINRNSETHPDPFMVEEIMQLFGHQMTPPPPPAPEHPDVEELRARIEALNAAYNGVDLRQNGQRDG